MWKAHFRVLHCAYAPDLRMYVHGEAVTDEVVGLGASKREVTIEVVGLDASR